MDIGVSYVFLGSMMVRGGSRAYAPQRKMSKAKRGLLYKLKIPVRERGFANSMAEAVCAGIEASHRVQEEQETMPERKDVLAET